MAAVRRLAAILAADVAGDSRLRGADEEGGRERLKAHLGELVEPKIKEHRGRIVKSIGGFLAEFTSVVDAVRCAAEVQRGMAEREPEVLDEHRIKFRIGINLGDVIVDGDDIYGDAVDIAGRLVALAESGGICISRVVRDQTRGKLPYHFENRGELSVKNVAQPVGVYAMEAPMIAPLPAVASTVLAASSPRGLAARVAALVRGGVPIWRAASTRGALGSALNARVRNAV